MDSEAPQGAGSFVLKHSCGCGQNAEALGWAGSQLLTDLRQWPIRKVLGQQSQQATAQEGQVGQEAGVAAAGAVLAHEDIAPPVITDFDSAPVSANERQPLGRTVLVGQGAGEVVMGFSGGLAGLFDSAAVAQHRQASGKGEVGFQGFEGKGVQVSGFDAAMAGVGVGKKGVSWSASRRWAFCSRWGWLPLIWSR